MWQLAVHDIWPPRSLSWGALRAEIKIDATRSRQKELFGSASLSQKHVLYSLAITLMMAPDPHSELEVVPHSTHDTHKYPYYSPEPIPAYPNTATDTNKIAYESVTYEAQPQAARTICGLRKRTFWILMIVAIVVIAAAVGGGVGGALASRSSSNSNSNSNDNNAQTPEYSAQPSSMSQTSTPTQALTTSTIIGPTSSPLSTILRDCPSSNNTIYAVTWGSTSQNFRKLCSNAYLNVNGISNVVGGVTDSLDACIDRCAIYNRNNATEIQAGRDRICNAVCWRNTFDKANDWAGGQCFGYTTQNTTIDGQTAFRVQSKAEVICDSAALINQDL